MFFWLQVTENPIQTGLANKGIKLCHWQEVWQAPSLPPQFSWLCPRTCVSFILRLVVRWSRQFWASCLSSTTKRKRACFSFFRYCCGKPCAKKNLRRPQQTSPHISFVCCYGWLDYESWNHHWLGGEASPGITSFSITLTVLLIQNGGGMEYILGRPPFLSLKCNWLETRYNFRQILDFRNSCSILSTDWLSDYAQHCIWILSLNSWQSQVGTVIPTVSCIRRLRLSEIRQFALIYAVSSRTKEHNARTFVPNSFLSPRAQSSDSWVKDQISIWIAVASCWGASLVNSVG